MDIPTDLVLDVGNTRTKLALFKGERRVMHWTIATGDIETVRRIIAELTPGHIAVGAVANEDPALLELLGSHAPVLVITGATDTPLRSRYDTPTTLGVDRQANAVGAAALFAERAVLAVDLGTCITYDVVEADGTYQGGAITPGMRMRAAAMHEHSARLPLVEPGVSQLLLGTSTQQALEAGIHHGIVGELREFMQGVAYHSPDVAVVLTGGDAPRFARALKSGIFAHPFLTLEGLRIISHHHRAGRSVHGDPVPR